MARVAFASRPALKSPCGSSRNAPLKKFTFTWSLKPPTAQTIPSRFQTAVFHFQSSMMSGSAAFISLRSRAKTLLRQSPRSAICLSISLDAFISYHLKLDFLDFLSRADPCVHRVGVVLSVQLAGIE